MIGQTKYTKYLVLNNLAFFVLPWKIVIIENDYYAFITATNY